MEHELRYVCWACGEEIVAPYDPSEGPSQDYVEDCPICCRPNRIRVERDEEGDLHAWAEED